MKIEIVHSITDNIYHITANFENLSIYHTKPWHQCLSQTFGWNVQAVLGYENEELSFFLPFISKYRINLKKYNITLPFSHKVGVAYNEIYEDKFDEFVKKFNNQFDTFEIHDDIKHAKLQNVASNDITVLKFTKFQTLEQLYKSFDYKSIRYSINRAKKNSICIKDDYTKKNFNIFYELEVKTRKRQGAPIYPKDFFINLYEHFKDTDTLSIYIAYYENMPVSGAIFFHFRDTTIYGYAASVSNREIKKLGIGEFVLWNAIQNSFSQNIIYFDFGTTPLIHDNLRRYKEKWGGKTVRLPYTFPKNKGIQTHSIKRDSLGVKLVSELLKKTPESLFKILSPQLLKLVI